MDWGEGGGVCSQAMSWQVGKRQTWTCLRAQPCPPDTSVAADTEWDEAMSQVQQANHPAATSQSSVGSFKVLFTQQLSAAEKLTCIGVCVSTYRERNYAADSKSLSQFGAVFEKMQLDLALPVTSWSTFIDVVVARCAHVLRIHLIPIKGLTHRRRRVELFHRDRMENCRPLCHLFLVRRKALGRLQSKASLWRHARLCQSAGLKCGTAHAGILQKCPNMFTSDHQTLAINMARNLDALMALQHHTLPSARVNFQKQHWSDPAPAGWMGPLLYQDFLPAVHVISFSSVLPQRERD